MQTQRDNETLIEQNNALEEEWETLHFDKTSLESQNWELAKALNEAKVAHAKVLQGSRDLKGKTKENKIVLFQTYFIESYTQVKYIGQG